MKAAAPRHYVLVLALLMVAAYGLVYAVDVDFVDETPVAVPFPDQVGGWTGEDLWYCVNRECTPRALSAAEVGNGDECPECEQPVNGGALAEIAQLPEDTIIRKKQYRHPSGASLVAAVVISGRERASIHRPQVCLTGGGQEIVGEEVLKVESARGGTLGVSLLDLVRRVPGQDGRPRQHTSFYAYWFVGKGHETPYHLERMFWMAADRVIHSRTSRWAYVSVSGNRRPDSDAHEEMMRDFLKDFHPLIRAESGDA